MNVRRKLFLAMTSIIIAMGGMFVATTHLVVKPIIERMLEVDRSKEMKELNSLFISYYQNNDYSWKGINQIQLDERLNGKKNISVLLSSPEDADIYSYGNAEGKEIRRLGYYKRIQLDEETIAHLYYHDPEIASISKIRIGISSSVSFLLLLSSFLFVLIAILGAHWLSKKLTKPLYSIISSIEQLGKGDYGVEAPVVTKDEYATVTKAFNQMSKQLKDAEIVRKNMTADIAHELRTPLTIISGKLDYLQQSGQSIRPKSLLPLQDELIRLTRLVEDLRSLSLAEAKKLPLNPTPTDIVWIFQRIIDRIEQDTEDKGILVSLSSFTDNTTIVVDPNRIMQVFLNLLTNAIRYTPAGGTVTVSIDKEILLERRIS
ncbi:sensor histidine kinase [Pseudalkalibacillus sp. A8]|uniref:sensor histidine kinase n=1 Tax=Pseudalkalibacillus sp. A8 TaxID=3382641 RepID=UPI0038B60EBD